MAETETQVQTQNQGQDHAQAPAQSAAQDATLDQAQALAQAAVQDATLDQAQAQPQAKPEHDKQTILVIDDNFMNRSLLADMLGENYNVIEAENGLEGVAAIQDYGSSISLILLDLFMPEMDGFEVLAVMNRRGWIKSIPVVIVSSETAPSAIRRAYDLGVTDFISRPFDTAVVHKRVTNTLALYMKQRALADMVEDEVYERQKSISLMVSILSHIVEFRNGESGLHVLHVNTMTRILLNEIAKRTDKFDLDTETIETITLASSLHDIGKISIKEEILNKPGKFTDEEFEIMKTHSATGAEMLKNLPTYGKEPLLDTAYEICRWHHERWDGRGYPDGLVGEEIPISAQVVALADVYDALTSERVYKKAYSHETAVDMIMNGECGAFNPMLLDCFVAVGDVLKEELHISSLSTDSRESVRRSAEMTSLTSLAGDLAPSSRTLDMLEYERQKFQFYAMMSNEVQFEFTVDPPVATISDWGTSKLGLAERILTPMNDQSLIDMFTKEGMEELQQRLLATTLDEPIIEYDLEAVVDGEPRWLHLAARAMWSEGDNGLEFVGAIGKLVDIHESRKRLSELERKATHDSLTGVANHAYARMVIAERIEMNPDATFVLMVMDMDKFKDANDTYGHLFGDEVLKYFAAQIRHSVRDHDVIARVGGDEFLICMEVEGDPQPVIDRIYKSICGQYENFPISISMGVIAAKGSDANYDTMFKYADNLLYDMKAAGRGGYIYRDSIEETTDEDGQSESVLSEIESNAEAVEE